MKTRIPFNPFHGSEDFKTKNPKDMTLDELEILLHSKRLNLRLDVERLHKHINYTNFLFEVIKASGLGEMVEELFTSDQQSKEDTKST